MHHRSVHYSFETVSCLIYALNRETRCRHTETLEQVQNNLARLLDSQTKHMLPSTLHISLLHLLMVYVKILAGKASLCYLMFIHLFSTYLFLYSLAATNNIIF